MTNNASQALGGKLGAKITTVATTVAMETGVMTLVTSIEDIALIAWGRGTHCGFLSTQPQKENDMQYDANASYEWLAEEFRKETGMMAPGKDNPIDCASHSYEERRQAWNAWIGPRSEQAWREWHEKRGMLAAHSAGAQDRADDAFEAWKNDPRFYQWNTTDEHAALNFSAGWNAHSVAHPQPMTEAARDVKRWREKIIQSTRAPSRGDFTVAINAILREMTDEIERLDSAKG